MTKTKFIHLTVCLLFFIYEIESASFVDSKHSETIEYLQTYGYLPKDKITDKQFLKALEELQVCEKIERCKFINFHKLQIRAEMTPVIKA